ncbi:ABC transporter permease [Photobacterium nomapromontoriensis]|uniref:ABC transporter permease n=1 Tax=Photobacterium nomapromontoriensis TaxID=2910237 RepID=UPI003D0B5204
MIQLLYVIALLLCFTPLLPGLLGLLLPAISWLPPLGYHSPDLTAFGLVSAWPGLSTSICLTLFTGIGSSWLALLFSFFILRRYWDTSRWQWLENTLSPMLALPHVAFAIGFAFLFSPSGWIYRLLEWVGINTQQGLSIIQDPYGIGLLLALAIKETPFLLLMSIPVLQQLQTSRLNAVSASLGYDHKQSWLRVVLPLLLPKLRLPLFAVAAYGLSVVDVALIIGPSRPTTLAVLVWQWFNEPDLQQLPRAAVGALLLLTITLVVLGGFRAIEWLLLSHHRRWLLKGALPRKGSQPAWFHQLIPLYTPFILLPILVVPILTVWSFAQRWRFPELFPSRFSTRFWQQELEPLLQLSTNSILLALISSAIALILAIGCLEYRQKHHRGLPNWLIAIPLVVPQLSLLFGVQVATYLIPGQHYWLWVVWSHLFFVFPYLYLTLDGAWRSYDVRLDQCSRSLGMTGWQTWWQIKRPQVQPAILMGLAVGISVSLAQYLSTQMLGAGRISTVTTEAVALASGQDRRVTAIYGLLQGVLPFIFFSMAFVTNRLTTHYQHHRHTTQQQRSTHQDDTVCNKPHCK